MKNSYHADSVIKNGLVFLLIILCALGLFIWLAINVKAGKSFLIDQEAFAVTFAIRNHSIDLLMEAFTFLGSSTFLLPANILLILGVLFYKKDRLFALQWTITAIISLFLMYFFKGIYQRPRPLDPYLETALGYSFPSGHTLNGFIFFGLLIMSLWKYVGNSNLRLLGTILFTILILFIGISRIYLRVHYASDVFGGWALGITWLTLCDYLFGLSGKRKNAILA